MAVDIIANLGGELTPDIINQLNSPSILSIIMGLVVCVALLFLFFGFLTWIFGKIFTKSGEYRKLLVDMYVVGMIKKFAMEENLDLVKELKEFNRLEKKKSFSEKDLDKVIEDNLKEKVDAKSEKDLEKIEKEF